MLDNGRKMINKQKRFSFDLKNYSQKLSEIPISDKEYKVPVGTNYTWCTQITVICMPFYGRKILHVGNYDKFLSK